jgi:hypothetical protein
MNCYFCEQTSAPGGMRLRSISAAGICHDCGVGVCRRHSSKLTKPVAALLCRECANLRKQSRPAAAAPGLSRSA